MATVGMAAPAKQEAAGTVLTPELEAIISTDVGVGETLKIGGCRRQWMEKAQLFVSMPRGAKSSTSCT